MHEVTDLSATIPTIVNSTPKSSSTDRIKVACVGDSLTYGFGASTKGKSYPGYLQSLMGSKFDVRNFGADGVTAIEYPHTHEGGYKHTHGYWRVQDFKPDYIVVMLGTNDSKRKNWNPKKFENDLSELVKNFQDIDSQPIVYLVIPPRLEPTSEVLDLMQMQPTVVA